MRMTWLGGAAATFAILAAQVPTDAASRTQSAPSAQAQSNQLVTVTGCIAAGATPADSMMLAGATVVGAGTTTPGAPTAGAPTPGGTVMGTTGVPPVGSGATGRTATGSPTTGTPPAGAAGTTGAAATTGVAGSTARSSAAVSGYRLSGADVRQFVGQRVRIVGTLAPIPSSSGLPAAGTAGAAGGATAAGTAGATAASGTTGTAGLPQLRVISVQPIGGGCR